MSELRRASPVRDFARRAWPAAWPAAVRLRRAFLCSTAYALGLWPASPCILHTVPTGRKEKYAQMAWTN